MPKPIYNDVRLILGDCLEKMQSLRDNSIDSIVTDPPYGIKFMSKRWDHNIPSVEIWEECLRVLKPGGFLLSFGGCRTYHRLVCNIEDAGFTIHPLIAWIFGSGFPKATNLSKMIDKAAGAEREVVGVNHNDRPESQVKGGMAFDRALDQGQSHATLSVTAPATEAAKQWDGWFYGLQALKPAIEPVCMAQKSYDGKPVESIQKWQCGALNIDGCRVGTEDKLQSLVNDTQERDLMGHMKGKDISGRKIQLRPAGKGRHPANLIHDGSDEVLELFPSPHGAGSKRGGGEAKQNQEGGLFGVGQHEGNGVRFGDSGSAARFFYCAKANKKDRNSGLENGEKSNHPTVKPTDLMRYLCRLVTPPGGLVLDPYMGSGSTGKAALKEGFKFVGIELEEEYFEIAEKRVTLEQRSD